MSQLIYNGVDFSEVKTLEWRTEPVYDKTGQNVLWVKLTIEVSAVCHPLWVASGKQANPGPGPGQGYVISSGGPGGGGGGGGGGGQPGAPVFGNMGVAGNRLGVSMATLPELLNQSRGKLIFRVGFDRVIESPPPPFPDGTSFDCDPGGGPLVSNVRVAQITGDKSAFVSMRIETHLNRFDTYCVSNVWASEVSIDDGGFTTRTTRGQAIFRQDFLRWADLNADHFRQFLLIDTGPYLRRVGVNCVLNEVGNILDYVVVDREVVYGTGDGGPVMKIEGNATAGGHVPVKSLKGAVEVLLPSVMNPSSITAGGIMRGIWNNLVPEGYASAMVRVHGRLGADKRVLARIALAVGASRFLPMWIAKQAVIVGCHLTETVGSEDQPMVELRLELMTTFLLATFMFDPTTIFSLMSLRTDIGPVSITSFSLLPDQVVETFAIDYQDTTPPADIGFSENTRGSWIESLAVQALGKPGVLPPEPAAPEDSDPDADEYA